VRVDTPVALSTLSFNGTACGHSPVDLTSAIVQVSRTPGWRIHPRAGTAGVREAPRHEIAGSWRQRRNSLYGDYNFRQFRGWPFADVVHRQQTS